MKSIQSKILISVLSVLIISVGIIGYTSIYFSKSALKEQVEKNTILLSEGYAGELDSKFDFYSRLTKTLALSVFNAVSIENVMIDMKRSYPEFSQLFYTGLSGKILEYHPRNNRYLSLDFRNEAFWNQVITNWNEMSKNWTTLVKQYQKNAQTYIFTSSVVVSDVVYFFESPSIIISAPVPVYYGGTFIPPEIQGVIIVVIPLKEIFKKIKNIKIGDTGAVLVISSTGKILYHPEKTRILNTKLSENGKNTALNNIEQAMTGQNTGIGQYTYNHRKYFLSFAPVPKVSWSLGVFGPLDEFTHGINKLTLINIIILAVSVFVSIIVITFLVKNLVSPLKHLADVITNIRNGNLNVKARVSSKDEIGQLASTLNTMSRQLELSFNERETLVIELKGKYIELERLHKIKDEFLANTSHELRTPLNGIIGIAESLIDGATGKLEYETKYNLSMIVASGHRLASLVNDILDFSRMKNRDIVLQQKPVDINSVARLAVSLSQHISKGKSICFVNQIPEDIPFVFADENRLQQIFLNLLGNAVKFTDQGEICLSAQVKKNKIIVSISDTGIGISPENQVRIFEAFEQADGSSSRRFGGTGLGLSITKTLVELHGGRIYLESKPGHGTIFYFTLPVAENKTCSVNIKNNIKYLSKNVNSDNDEHIKKVIPHNDKAGRTALIVDDEPVNIQILQNHLHLCSYKTFRAVNGFQALEILEKEKPDIILLDIMMPGINGYEVCEKIRKSYDATTLPIIMLTAKNQVSDLVRGLQCGANDYIVKPFRKQELFARINTHITIKEITFKYKELNKTLESKVKERTAELETVNQKLEHLSNIDGLTQLYNRRYFDIYLSNEWKRMQRDNLHLSLIMCDIDHFKMYNDTYGHQEGDECIRQVAGAIAGQCHRSSDIAVRYGGEEFVIILPQTDLKGAVHIAELIRKAVEQLNISHKTSSVKNIVSISLGTASIIPDIKSSPEELIRFADQALYTAKEEGRDRVSF